MASKPIYDGYSCKLPNEKGELDDIGSLHNPTSVDRLIALGFFLYHSEWGVVSVRLEQRKRGSEAGYWTAYKRLSGRLRKTYLCEAHALDPYNLDEAARRIFSQV